MTRSIHMDDSVDEWFIRNVLVHEAALTRYLMRVWADRAEVPDIRQEVYARVFEAALCSRPVACKSFVFATARHLLTDRIRRARVVSIEAREDLDALDVLIEELSPERRTSAHEDLRRLARAFDGLPPRCREIIWLRKVEGLPQKEVAARLGVHQKAIEKQVAKGTRLLARALYGASDVPATLQELNQKQDGSER